MSTKHAQPLSQPWIDGSIDSLIDGSWVRAFLSDTPVILLHSGNMKQGLIPLLVVTIAVGGCGSEESVADDPAPQKSTEQLSEQPDSSPQEQLQAEGPDTLSLQPGADEATEEQPQPAPASVAEGSEFLQTDIMPPLYPRDFEIGLLQSTVALTVSAKQAYATVSALLWDLSRGSVRGESLAPEVREDLSGTLAYHLQQGNTFATYRIGAAQPVGSDELRLNVRLFAALGATEGEVYVARSQDTWLVTDVQIGFPELRRASEPRVEPFMPSAYEIN